jgi:hypothetical protein
MRTAYFRVKYLPSGAIVGGETKRSSEYSSGIVLDAAQRRSMRHWDEAGLVIRGQHPAQCPNCVQNSSRLNPNSSSIVRAHEERSEAEHEQHCFLVGGDVHEVADVTKS